MTYKTIVDTIMIDPQDLPILKEFCDVREYNLIVVGELSEYKVMNCKVQVKYPFGITLRVPCDAMFISSNYYKS